MTRLSRALVIGGVYYPIERAPRRKIGGPADIHHERPRIRIAEECGLSAALAYVDHEKTHGAWYQSGAAAILQRYVVDASELEELLVDPLATTLRTIVVVK